MESCRGYGECSHSRQILFDAGKAAKERFWPSSEFSVFSLVSAQTSLTWQHEQRYFSYTYFGGHLPVQMRSIFPQSALQSVGGIFHHKTVSCVLGSTEFLRPHTSDVLSE